MGIFITLALCALVAMPAAALAQSAAPGLSDETEPDTVIQSVKANKRGTLKVFFTGTDPFDPVSSLQYDCAVDPKSGDLGSEDMGEDDEEDWDSEEGWEDDFDPDESQVPLSADNVKWECKSPWVVKGLEPGRHTVAVMAWDEEWNEDPTPARAGFKVKRPKRPKP